MEKGRKIALIIFVLALLIWIPIIYVTYLAEPTRTTSEPFFNEDFNGLIVSANDVTYTKNEDTGKVIVNVSIHIKNTKSTSFSTNASLLKYFTDDMSTSSDIPSKIKGGEEADGTLSIQTDVNDASELDDLVFILYVEDMSTYESHDFKINVSNQ